MGKKEESQEDLEKRILEEKLGEEFSEEGTEDGQENEGEDAEDESEKSEDEDAEDEKENEDDEELIGKIRLGVSSSNFSRQPIQETDRKGLEKEVFTYDGELDEENLGVDLVEEKYKSQDREEQESEVVKYGLNEENPYDSSSGKHYNERGLSRNDDFEVEIGARDLKDDKRDEFYTLRKEKEDNKNSVGLFRSDERTYFEARKKDKEYLA